MNSLNNFRIITESSQIRKSDMLKEPVEGKLYKVIDKDDNFNRWMLQDQETLRKVIVFEESLIGRWAKFN